MVEITAYEHETFIVSYSYLSCFFSFLVILTYCTFKEMRNKIYFKFIFFMSLSDFFMNIASAIGFPENDSEWCQIQGFGQNYFSITSWFWTTSLSYTMNKALELNTFGIMSNLPPMKYFHLLNWGLPLIITIIPLFTYKYSQFNNGDYQWCLIQLPNKYNTELYYIILKYFIYFFWLFLCVLLMLYWTIKTNLRIRNGKNINSLVISVVIQKIRWYPIVMIICWMMSFLCNLDMIPQTRIVITCSMLFGVTNGMFTAIIYFYQSEEARQRWKGFFYDLFYCNNNYNDSNDSFNTEDRHTSLNLDIKTSLNKSITSNCDTDGTFYSNPRKSKLGSFNYNYKEDFYIDENETNNKNNNYNTKIYQIDEINNNHFNNTSFINDSY